MCREMATQCHVCVVMVMCRGVDVVMCECVCSDVCIGV